MNASNIFIAIFILVLVLLILFVFFNPFKNRNKKLTPLASVAFAFVLTGIFFGEDRILGYSLIGMGVILAIADIIKNKNSKKEIM